MQHVLAQLDIHVFKPCTATNITKTCLLNTGTTKTTWIGRENKGTDFKDGIQNSLNLLIRKCMEMSNRNLATTRMTILNFGSERVKA